MRLANAGDPPTLQRTSASSGVPHPAMERKGRFLGGEHVRRSENHRSGVQRVYRPPFPGPSSRLLTGAFQNFFTNVKALIDQARARGPKVDSHHGYETPERELVDR